MDTGKFNDMEAKPNTENQITMIEMGDHNHCARSSTTEEYKKSGYELKIFYYFLSRKKNLFKKRTKNIFLFSAKLICFNYYGIWILFMINSDFYINNVYLIFFLLNKK